MSTSKSQLLILILILISILFTITTDSKGGGGRAGGVSGSARSGGIYGGGSSSSSGGYSSGGRSGSSSGGRSGSGGRSSSGGRSGSGSGASRGGGIYGGSRDGSGSSSGSGGWFKSGSKIGGYGSGMNRGKSWPKGSSSVKYGGRSMRIIPIPIFMSMGGFGYGYGNGYGHDYGRGHGQGYHGDRRYSRQMYKEEDGFYPCPPDIVAMHRETLNKSVDDAIKSGQFNELFLGLNSNIPINGTFDGNSFHPSITTTPQLIDQIQSAIESFTFMCYDENRDQNNEYWNQNNWNQNNWNRNQSNWNIDTNYWSGDQISENIDPNEFQDQNNGYNDFLIGVVPIAVLILFLCCFCLVRHSVKVSSRNANYDQDYEAVKPTAPIDSN